MTSAAVPQPRDQLKGILFLCGGAMIFTVQDVIIKWISGDYPVAQILATRSLVAYVPMCAILYLDGGLKAITWRRKRLLLLRGILMFLSYMAYYLGIVAIPLAEAAALFYTVPLFIVALSGPMLKERIGPGRWLAVVAGFMGAVIMLRPGAGVIDPAAFFSLLSAVLYAVAQLLARDLGANYNASIMGLSQNSVNLVAALGIGLVAGDGAYEAGASHPSLIFLLRPWAMPDVVDLLLMAATGVIAGVAIWCLTHAYRIAPATVIAPFEYCSIIWVVLLAYLIWGEVPQPLTILGGAMIIIAGAYVLGSARR